LIKNNVKLATIDEFGDFKNSRKNRIIKRKGKKIRKQLGPDRSTKLNICVGFLEGEGLIAYQMFKSAYNSWSF
jgi:hypothetical protein